MLGATDPVVKAIPLMVFAKYLGCAPLASHQLPRSCVYPRERGGMLEKSGKYQGLLFSREDPLNPSKKPQRRL